MTRFFLWTMCCNCETFVRGHLSPAEVEKRHNCCEAEVEFQVTARDAPWFSGDDPKLRYVRACRGGLLCRCVEDMEIATRKLIVQDMLDAFQEVAREHRRSSPGR